MTHVRTLSLIPPGVRRGWRLVLNGEEAPSVTSVSLAHPRFGELMYGWASEGPGYDTWSFAERGGGGAVVVPYTIFGDVPWLGLVRQHRRTQGCDCWNVPRGFIDPGEIHKDTAVRELVEETGLTIIGSIHELPGAPGNPNSAFFETLGEEGVRMYAVEVAAVVWTDGELRPKRGTVDESLKDRKEDTRELVFRKWTDVVKLSDLFSVAATARLLAYLGK